jgi:hypothetical protein
VRRQNKAVHQLVKGMLETAKSIVQSGDRDNQVHMQSLLLKHWPKGQGLNEKVDYLEDRLRDHSREVGANVPHLRTSQLPSLRYSTPRYVSTIPSTMLSWIYSD